MSSAKEGVPMWFDVPRQMVLTELRKRATVPEKVFLTYYAVDDTTANIVWGVSKHDAAAFYDVICLRTAEALTHSAFAPCSRRLVDVQFHIDTSPH